MRDSLERVERVIHALNSAFFDRLFGVGDGGFDLAGNRAHLLAIFVQGLLHLIDQPIKFIARFNLVPFTRVVR